MKISITCSCTGQRPIASILVLSFYKNRAQSTHIVQDPEFYTQHCLINISPYAGVFCRQFLSLWSFSLALPLAKQHQKR